MNGQESEFGGCQGFKDFVAGGEMVLKGWIKLLVDSSDIFPESYNDEFDKVTLLLASTSLSNIQVLEYLAFAYSRPCSGSLFGRLLLHGAELADEQFIKGLCDVVSKAAQGFAAEDVARGIAAASPSLTEFLSHLPLDNDKAILNNSDIYLRAMQLHNNPNSRHAPSHRHRQC
jgi:hypothetical protein